jgi:hypothetical protein
VARKLRLPPWEVESNAPIHWVERTLFMLEVEEQANKWETQKAEAKAKSRRKR